MEKRTRNRAAHHNLKLYILKHKPSSNEISTVSITYTYKKVRKRRDSPIQIPMVAFDNNKRIIKKRYIEKSGPIEESICNVDLCVGTNSTALLRQTIFLNKPIIQLYAKEHFMWDTSKTLTSVNNEEQIFFLIKKLLHLCLRLHF